LVENGYSGDEPMVVLDAQQDWRFSKNVCGIQAYPWPCLIAIRQPLVLGEPFIRFYAGAPLRTQDGFNIGRYQDTDVNLVELYLNAS
jgi:GAF domain-containing protein